MACVGAPPDPPLMPTFSMLFRRLRVAGSLIGGIKETQEMLDYCAEKVGLNLTAGLCWSMSTLCVWGACEDHNAALDAPEPPNHLLGAGCGVHA
jgi:hypothetical protein